MSTEQQRIEDLISFVEQGVQESKRKFDLNEGNELNDLFDNLTAELNGESA